MTGLIVILALAAIALEIWAAVLFGDVVEYKGWADKKSAVILLCIFLPLAGYLLACALPDCGARNLTSSYFGTSDRNASNNDLPEL